MPTPSDDKLEFHDLLDMRRMHPAWRLLAADSAPLVVSFLHHTFIAPNVRTVAENELILLLDDYLERLRHAADEGDAPAAPRAPADYLRDWAGDERRWLRKYYREGGDEPVYDLTPSTERALRFVAELARPQFVGTESRLLTLFELLRQIAHGSETDPARRIEELERERARIDAEIERVRAGRAERMSAAQLRDRFHQVTDIARGLLADFRQLEQNFRDLDRDVRRRVAVWEGSKAELLEAVFGERDVIADSDEGRSFQAFWDWLMSPSRQEELGALLKTLLEVEEIAALRPDPRLRKMHFDWLHASESTQRTVRRLSEQMRRFLDDQVWLENRRIMVILNRIEKHALALRFDPPAGGFMALDSPGPQVEVPLERPLFAPATATEIKADEIRSGISEADTDSLFDQFHVDKDRLRARVRRALQSAEQVSLTSLLEHEPLSQGLSELVAWLSIAVEDPRAILVEEREEHVEWVDSTGRRRAVSYPGVIFSR